MSRKNDLVWVANMYRLDHFLGEFSSIRLAILATILRWRQCFHYNILLAINTVRLCLSFSSMLTYFRDTHLLFFIDRNSKIIAPSLLSADRFWISTSSSSPVLLVPHAFTLRIMGRSPLLYSRPAHHFWLNPATGTSKRTKYVS